MSSFAHWSAYLQRARDGYSRPIKHQTRVHWCGEDAICIEHHSTNIITFHRDGRITLANGGWYSNTTKQRLEEYAPVRIEPAYGREHMPQWSVRFEHDPNDPEPGHARRQIMKPFYALDPGPEPVDDGVGCRVGEVEEYEWQEDVVVYNFNHDRLREARGFPVLGSEWDRERGHTTLRVTRIAREEYHGASNGYHEHDEIRRRGHTGKLCPHCAAFAEILKAWRAKMYGSPWTTRATKWGERERYRSGEHAERGFSQMTEHLEVFGSREAWQEAYIEEFREVRKHNREQREWEVRNYCIFHGGIEVDSSGRVPLKLKREHEKELRRRARANRKAKREACQIEERRKRFERKRAYEREVKHQIILALTSNVNVELDALRPQWQAIKEKHHG